MALIRIFLLTYRRPALLPRALNSLLSQTFTDWVCELHNDAPEDDGPSQLLNKINDPRIILCQHNYSWGAAQSFRHAFAGGNEPFTSLLEDDNWWEPDFLETALKAIQSHPEVNLVWSNLNIWRENPDHSWAPTGRTIWQRTSEDDDSPRIFHNLQPLQCFDALHSNGATLFRTAISRSAQIPDDTLFDSIEFVRERLLPGPLMFLPKPLGNFSLTLKTARADSREVWLLSQLLCAGSYQAIVHPNKEELAMIWETLRSQAPPATNLLGIRPWTLLRHAKLIDWFFFIRGIVRRPLTSLRALRFRNKTPKTWRALLSAPPRKNEPQTDYPIYKKILF